MTGVSKQVRLTQHKVECDVVRRHTSLSAVADRWGEAARTIAGRGSYGISVPELERIRRSIEGHG